MKKLLLCMILCACGRDVTAPHPVEKPAATNGPCQRFVVRVDTVYKDGHHYEVRDSITAYYSHCPTP